ncbi:MAG: M20/M25/M40 family metallo-hydrolase [Gemmatimonadota bacterium]
MSRQDTRGRVLRQIDDAADELVAFASDLIRIPTVNPPGSGYRECATLIGDRLESLGFQTEYVEAVDLPEHRPDVPRVNVIGSLPGDGGPCVHLNGHFDVVPPGDGWTVDPFGGEVRDGRLYGRGSADMKAGLAAAVFAAAAIRRAGVSLPGTIEVSGTVDEESGGFAGVAHLARTGRIASGRTDYVIIPEPFGPDRICVGHRGVYWGRIVALGRTAHGSMPFMGRSAIDDLGVVLTMIRERLAPEIGGRITAMPVVPPRARAASINVNSVVGGQPDAEAGTASTAVGPSTRGVGPATVDPLATSRAESRLQTPCVADRAEAVIDRRFLIEERVEDVRAELLEVLRQAAAEDPGRDYELTDIMIVHPTLTPDGSPLVSALARAIADVRGREPGLVASPGTYDQKHVVRIAGVEHCVAYGPGELEQAHQPDESCAVEDILDSARVMALAVLELAGPPSD